MFFGKEHSALDLRMIDAGEVDRGTLPAMGHFHATPVCLQAANTNRPWAGKQVQFLAFVYLARGKCSGNDRTKALFRKAAVDRKARDHFVPSLLKFSSRIRKSPAKRFGTLIRLRAKRNNRRAFEHILYEPLVPGDINKAKMHTAGFEFGETEVDRYAAFLFLGQAVGVGPGQRAYERSFAVVDMPSRADDYIHSSIWIIARRGKGTR